MPDATPADLKIISLENVMRRARDVVRAHHAFLLVRNPVIVRPSKERLDLADAVKDLEEQIAETDTVLDGTAFKRMLKASSMRDRAKAARQRAKRNAGAR